MRRRIQKFFKTPKGQLTIILAILVMLAAPAEGWALVWPGMAGAILIAGGVDAVILRVRYGEWEFPSGAVLTAMIVAMVLRAQEPWYVTAAVSTFAVVSKYVVRSRSANVFNPAALAIVVSYLCISHRPELVGRIARCDARAATGAAGGRAVHHRTGE